MKIEDKVAVAIQHLILYYVSFYYYLMRAKRLICFLFLAIASCLHLRHQTMNAQSEVTFHQSHYQPFFPLLLIPRLIGDVAEIGGVYATGAQGLVAAGQTGASGIAAAGQAGASSADAGAETGTQVAISEANGGEAGAQGAVSNQEVSSGASDSTTVDDEGASDLSTVEDEGASDQSASAAGIARAQGGAVAGQARAQGAVEAGEPEQGLSSIVNRLDEFSNKMLLLSNLTQKSVSLFQKNQPDKFQETKNASFQSQFSNYFLQVATPAIQTQIQDLNSRNNVTIEDCSIIAGQCFNKINEAKKFQFQRQCENLRKWCLTKCKN